MDKPLFQIGSLACFCACEPPRGRRSTLAIGKEDDDVVEVADVEEAQELRITAKPLDSDRAPRPYTRSISPAAKIPEGNGCAAEDIVAVEAVSVAKTMEVSLQAPVQSNGKIDLPRFDESGNGCKAEFNAADILSPSTLSDFSTMVSPTSTLPAEGSAAAIPVPTPLGPLGAGGWHMEEDVTEEMRQVASHAVEMYAQREKKALTEFNERFLTSVTLANYVQPVASLHLSNALAGRARNEEILAGRKSLQLFSSFRVIGWDSAGASVCAVEPCMSKASLGFAIPQIEYVGWTAVDLNKPGAQGFTVVMDFGGGFNALHFLNPKPIIDLAAIVEGQWRRRLKAAIIIDMPSSFKSILATFLMFIKGNTSKKIHFISSAGNAVKELERMGCEEETLETARRYLAARRDPNAKQLYHPVVDHSFFRERLSEFGLSQDTSHVMQDVHSRLREVVQEFRISRWGLPESSTGAQDCGKPLWTKRSPPPMKEEPPPPKTNFTSVLDRRGTSLESVESAWSSMSATWAGGSQASFRCGSRASLAGSVGEATPAKRTLFESQASVQNACSSTMSRCGSKTSALGSGGEAWLPKACSSTMSRCGSKLSAAGSIEEAAEVAGAATAVAEGPTTISSVQELPAPLRAKGSAHTLVALQEHFGTYFASFRQCSASRGLCLGGLGATASRLCSSGNAKSGLSS